MKKIISIAAVFVAILLGSCNTDGGKAENAPQIAHKFIDVKEYEQARAELYDAALDLLLTIKRADNGDWLDIDDESREVIANYRAPSLQVMLNAIEQLELRPYQCLGDAYDWELGNYYGALRRYEQIIK